MMFPLSCSNDTIATTTGTSTTNSNDDNRIIEDEEEEEEEELVYIRPSVLFVASSKSSSTNPGIVPSSTVQTVSTTTDELLVLKRRVERVSKRAALVGKRKIWDSNTASIDIALSAVDRWEAMYLTMKHAVQSVGVHLVQAYEASKAGAYNMEHQFLLPLRDYVVLPTFFGLERLFSESYTLVVTYSPHLHTSTVVALRRFPYIGEQVLAPLYQSTMALFQELYTIIQYPIPSRKRVAEVTDQALTSLKWLITTAAQSIHTYATMVDASITRTLMHTQWRILKSGPYATLDSTGKREVLDHICERYFSLHLHHQPNCSSSTHTDSTIARYEFIAHIKANNQRLYMDLVGKGLLHQRSRQIYPHCGLLSYDVWLTTPIPIYRRQTQQQTTTTTTTATTFYQSSIFDESCSFIEENFSTTSSLSHTTLEVIPLWFYKPSTADGIQEQNTTATTTSSSSNHTNSKQKKKKNNNNNKRGLPWIPFVEQDIRHLEKSYGSYRKEKIVRNMKNTERQHTNEGYNSTVYNVEESSTGPLCHAIYDSVISILGFVTTTTTTTTTTTNCKETQQPYNNYNYNSIAEKAISCALSTSTTTDTMDVEFHHEEHHQYRPTTSYPSTCTTKTVAQWYEPDLSNDILVDQNRYAVSFLDCMDEDDSCFQCATDTDPISTTTTTTTSTTTLCPTFMGCSPSIKMIRRPTLWRFHGPGDEVRRSTWFVETKNGLQPYCEVSAAVLEDAYLFLKWYLSVNQRKCNSSVLLTVQVVSPDGDDQQLVQFASLTKITAVQKTLGGALSIFKSRVYRGACIVRRSNAANTITTTNNNSNPTSKISSEEKKELSVAMEQSVAVPITFVTNNKTISVTRSKNIEDVYVAEENISSEDKIDHLVLVVHGIGEMMRSVDIFGLGLPGLSSLITCCDWMRINHAEVQSFQAADTEGTMTKMQSEGRVEYIPVEWHEAFALESRRTPVAALQRGLSPATRFAITPIKDTPCLQHISLNTIPGLRSFVNDTLLDVLYFLSPQYHEKIISIVTMEMNLVFRKFQRLSGKGFSGRVSIVGHSLGSVITWDILAHQGIPVAFDNKVGDRMNRPITTKNEEDHFDFGSSSSFQREADLSPRSVFLDSTNYPQLCFPVCSTFMIGSPISVFLMIRNQHQPMSEDYFLPGCPRVFNIFHPYDPAAYRLEPLLNKYFSCVEPKLISHWRGGLRVQYQTKMVWNKIVEETRKAQRCIVGVVESAASQLGLLDTGNSDQEEEGPDNLFNTEFDVASTVTLRCGRLNQGRRIDYMLQEKEFENANEYVFAVGAHSAYWDEKDLSLFIAQELMKCKVNIKRSDKNIK